MNEITDDEFKALKRQIYAFYAENNNSIQIDNGLLPPYLAYDEDTNTYTYTTPNNHIFSINPEKADEIRDIIRGIRDEAIAEFTDHDGGKRRKRRKSKRTRKSKRGKRTKKSRKSRRR